MIRWRCDIINIKVPFQCDLKRDGNLRTMSLSVSDKLPCNGLTSVRRHCVGNSDRGCSCRPTYNLPYATFRTLLTSSCSSTNRFHKQMFKRLINSAVTCPSRIGLFTGRRECQGWLASWGEGVVTMRVTLPNFTVSSMNE